MASGQVELVAYALEATCTGRSLPRPVRELSAPVVTLNRRPLMARMMGASCQLLSNLFIHGLPPFTVLTATMDVLNTCRISKLQGPRSAPRLKGCELGEPPSSPVKSKSETQTELV